MKKLKQFISCSATTLILTLSHCNDLPPHPGVTTQINDLRVNNLILFAQPDLGVVQTPYEPYFTKDSKTTGAVIKYRYSLTHTKAVIQNFLPGTIEIRGSWGLELAQYGLQILPSIGGFVVIIPKRDGKKITDNSVSVVEAHYTPGYLPTSKFSFTVTFDDPNLAAPESHIYTLEFWECVGQCAIDDYSAITDKKAELNITYAVVP